MVGYYVVNIQNIRKGRVNKRDGGSGCGGGYRCGGNHPAGGWRSDLEKFIEERAKETERIMNRQKFTP
jgi:hypothetical protein